MVMITKVQKAQEQVTVSNTEVWRSTNNILSLFGMDLLKDIGKASSTHKIIEDMETKRNLAQRTIEAINEIEVEVIEKILIQPSKIVTLIEDSMQCVE